MSEKTTASTAETTPYNRPWRPQAATGLLVAKIQGPLSEGWAKAPSRELGAGEFFSLFCELYLSQPKQAKRGTN